MRPIDQNTINALSGSRAGDGLTVYAWYGGQLSYREPLPISNWDMDWDVDRQMQKFSCTVTDKEGELAPWLLEDPLGVGGGLLQVRYDVGGASPIRMGWYRIAGNVPDERWYSYIIDNRGNVNTDSPVPNDKQLLMVSGGSNIEVTAYDISLNAKLDRLLAPESPPSGSLTITAEITRLMRDHAPVVLMPGVAALDRNVARNIVYERERLDAIQDLCKRISCDYRMNGDGQLEIYPIERQGEPVAVLQGGPDGLLVKVDREQSIDGLYNRAVVDGLDDSDPENEKPIRAIAQIERGPLSIYGPHGKYPEFYSSTMIGTYEDAWEYANAMIRSQLVGMTVDLRVTCLPLPHLQQGDYVQVGNPVVNGQRADLIGRVRKMRLRSGNGTAAGPMELTVQCSYWQVQSVIGGARNRVR
jgi:hypothetical protein